MDMTYWSKIPSTNGLLALTEQYRELCDCKDRILAEREATLDRYVSHKYELLKIIDNSKKEIAERWIYSNQVIRPYFDKFREILHSMRVVLKEDMRNDEWNLREVDEEMETLLNKIKDLCS